MVDEVLRVMRLDDVEAVLDVQGPGAVAGLGAIFPQDSHPFPREELGRRWREEVEDSETHCYVVLHEGDVAGFAASRDDQLLHFGTAVGQWGTGLAAAAHDELLARMAVEGRTRAWLRVFEGNPRGRRFYEKLGWHETGTRSRSSFAPYPVLIRYERATDLT